MENDIMSDYKYHKLLESTYLFKKALFSFSFKDRVLIELGDITFIPRKKSMLLNKLSNKELEAKLRSIKSPWWNGIFKKIAKRTKLLLAIKLLFIQKDFSKNGLRLLFKLLKTRTNDI